jgi:superfamily II DNA or RNA helicase
MEWKVIIENFTNAKVVIIDSNTDYDQVKNNNCILVSTINQSKNIPTNIKNQIGFLVLDEAHWLCTQNNINYILEYHPKYIMALTATPNREDGLFTVINRIIE